MAIYGGVIRSCLGARIPGFRVPQMVIYGVNFWIHLEAGIHSFTTLGNDHLQPPISGARPLITGSGKWPFTEVHNPHVGGDCGPPQMAIYETLFWASSLQRSSSRSCLGSGIVSCKWSFTGSVLGSIWDPVLGHVWLQNRVLQMAIYRVRLWAPNRTIN